MASKKTLKVREKREKRTRSKISGTQERPRLSIFRSLKHIYVQAIDDVNAKTVAEASTLSKDVDKKINSMKKVEAAREVGKLIAQKLQAMGIEKIVFDRGRFLYHGRVKALAEAARENGLKF
ncbi:MAG TPA: 50S ribosomal protein L18 [Smithella sp.]|nr:50S ribosomal protein L18 [Smithella sp.]